MNDKEKERRGLDVSYLTQYISEKQNCSLSLYCVENNLLSVSVLTSSYTEQERATDVQCSTWKEVCNKGLENKDRRDMLKVRTH